MFYGKQLVKTRLSLILNIRIHNIEGFTQWCLSYFVIEQDNKGLNIICQKVLIEYNLNGNEKQIQFESFRKSVNSPK